MEETWRDIPTYEGAYQVSDQGRVRSLPGDGRRGIVLKPGRAGRGYPAVGLFLNGVRVGRYVHHLVALVFIGPRPEGLDVCHNNGDFTDNRVENLRYGTVTSNIRDAVAHGTHKESSRTVCDHDHDLTGENILIEPNGVAADGTPKFRRRCRACLKRKSRVDYIKYRERHGLSVPALV